MAEKDERTDDEPAATKESDDEAQAEKNLNLRARAKASERGADQRRDAKGYQGMLARTPAAKMRRAQDKLYDNPRSQTDGD